MSGMKTRRDGGGGNKVKTRFWQDRRLRQGWDQKGGVRGREIKAKRGAGKKQGWSREKARVE